MDAAKQFGPRARGLTDTERAILEIFGRRNRRCFLDCVASARSVTPRALHTRDRTPMPLTFRMHRVPSPRRPAVEPMDASALRAMCEPIEVDTIEEAEARDAEWQAAIAANERLMEEMKITPRR